MIKVPNNYTRCLKTSAKRSCKLPKTEDVEKLGNFKKIFEMVRIKGEPLVVPENCKRSALKLPIKKPNLPDFVNLFIIFCPRLKITQ